MRILNFTDYWTKGTVHWKMKILTTILLSSVTPPPISGYFKEVSEWAEVKVWIYRALPVPAEETPQEEPRQPSPEQVRRQRDAGEGTCNAVTSLSWETKIRKKKKGHQTSNSASQQIKRLSYVFVWNRPLLIRLNSNLPQLILHNTSNLVLKPQLEDMRDAGGWKD